jgi:two-component system, LytTR family, sensor kinase
MIKDKFLRFFFIPLLGIVIPYLSGVITYSLYSPLELIAISVFFIFMSWSIWVCSTWLHHKIRTWFKLDQNTFIKISTISLSNALFGGAIAGILTLIFYKISKENFVWTYYLLTVILSVLAVIVFTLVYEILYLSKEREIDSKVVDQLDWERSMAEMSNLKNELEPHFIFNCLNTLSHLILNDPETAHVFNSKLASVYKYFLINKDRDMISLHNEMEFIDNYFFIVQLRYDNQLNLCSKLDAQKEGKLMIVPFALQIALENAIKHNEFTADDPLYISIELKDDFVLIKNNKKQKKYSEQSTGIGLKNLRSRYQLSCKKNIKIEVTDKEYIVKLPIIYQNT